MGPSKKKWGFLSTHSFLRFEMNKKNIKKTDQSVQSSLTFNILHPFHHISPTFHPHSEGRRSPDLRFKGKGKAFLVRGPVGWDEHGEPQKFKTSFSKHPFQNIQQDILGDWLPRYWNSWHAASPLWAMQSDLFFTLESLGLMPYRTFFCTVWIRFDIEDYVSTRSQFSFAQIVGVSQGTPAEVRQPQRVLAKSAGL